MSKLLPTPKDVLTSNTGELSKRMETIIDKLHTYNGTVGVYFNFPLTYAIQKELDKCGWQVYRMIDQSGFWVQPKRFPIKFTLKQVTIIPFILSAAMLLAAFCLQDISSIKSVILVAIFPMIIGGVVRVIE